MTDKQYIDCIHRGHFLYWDMLGKLHGNENHKEKGLQWLTGGINYNYFTDSFDIDGIIRRIKNKEIPENLFFHKNISDMDPSEAFIATGFFKVDCTGSGMAHELMDTSLPKLDKRLNLFRVREASQLKSAGVILNSAFSYRLFTFGHFIEMMENSGQFFHLAEYDGLPVGACMSQHGDDFMNISWVGTLPGYRKLGIAGYLIQAAERNGIQHGKSTGVLCAYQDAVGAYKRVGYREYCQFVAIELAK